MIVPWEEERGIVESKPQVLCFVTRFGKNEFISSDAMSKLRQVNKFLELLIVLHGDHFCLLPQLEN